MDKIKKSKYDNKKVIEKFEEWLNERTDYLEEYEFVDFDSNAKDKLAEMHRVYCAFVNIKSKCLILK